MNQLEGESILNRLKELSIYCHGESGVKMRKLIDDIKEAMEIKK